jgi:phenylacetate-CoA ligase
MSNLPPRNRASSPLVRSFWSGYTLWHARGDDGIPYQPLERIEALQRRRLRSIVDHAYATVPHYREAIDDAGLHPRDLRSASDLAQLPLIAGEDLAGSPERFASRAYPPSTTLALESSGTSGRRKTVRYSTSALFVALAHGQRQRAVLAHFVGRRTGYREMVARRTESVAAQLRSFYEANAWVPRRMDVERAMLPIELSFDQALERINAFRPDVLYGYGSFVGPLFRWAVERGRSLHRPRVIWYGSDSMPDPDRALLEDEIGVPVISTYQADEALRIGYQCERRRGFHLFLDAVAVRVVDDRGREVGPGESGNLVLSNLTNRATVLLNYRLGDRVTLAAEPCPCGRSLPMIERIEGRADDLILLANGEARHPIAVLWALQKVPGVVRVQIVQEEITRVRLLVVGAAGIDWPVARAQLDSILRSLLGAGVVLEIERVDGIAPEPSGKVKAVVCRCAPLSQRSATSPRAGT